MQPLGMFMLGVVGLICIYVGYQLFCDLPAVNCRSPRSRGGVLLLNIVPGAILGLTGMGILTAELRMAISERPAVPSVPT